MNALRRLAFGVFVLAVVVVVANVAWRHWSEPQTGADGDAVAQGSEFALQILDDGAVSRSEIELARSATVDCLAADGFSARFVEQDDRVSNLDVDSGPPRAGESDEALGQRFERVFDQCTREFLSDVNTAWLRATAPSEEELQRSFDELQECAGRVGITVMAPTPDELGQLAQRSEDVSLSEATRSLLVGCLTAYATATASGGA